MHRASASSISPACRVNFSKLTLVAEFLVMAVVLIARPYGLARARAGRGAQRRRAGGADPPGDAGAEDRRRWCCWWCWPACRCSRKGSPYTLVLGIDVLIAILFADQPAFHHGPRRHAFVRPRRLFRARRLWRGAAGEMAGGADGAGAGRRAGRRRCSARCCSAGSRCGCPASISPC